MLGTTAHEEGTSWPTKGIRRAFLIDTILSPAVLLGKACIAKINGLRDFVVFAPFDNC